MYTVLNKTQNTRVNYWCNFPLVELENMLNNGDKLIVISEYSKTVKVPHSIEENGIIYWEWEEYNM